MTGVVSWWAYVVRYEARELWRSLPGPWPVKIALIVVCAAVPGPGDELALIGITAVLRNRRNRKTSSE